MFKYMGLSVPIEATLSSGTNRICKLLVLYLVLETISHLQQRQMWSA